MDLELKGKVAVVGGTSKGLGERATQEIRDRTGADVLAVAGDLDRHDAARELIADEVGRDGILVNNVCPGSILTERMLANVTARARELGISVEQALAQRAAETAVGHIGDPREMAYPVAFLASGKSSDITGTTMLVGGSLVRSVL